MKKTLLFVFVAVFGLASFATAQSTEPSAEEKEMVTKVLRLLDHPLPSGLSISIRDFRQITADSLETYKEIVMSVALVFKSDRNVINLHKKSKYFVQAMKGDEFSLYVLASALVHEAEHTQGFGECQAFAEQMKVWNSYMERSLVTGKPAKNYASFLEASLTDNSCNSSKE